MVEGSFKHMETRKCSIKEITMVTKDKEQYFALQKQFRAKVQEYFDKNLLYVD